MENVTGVEGSLLLRVLVAIFFTTFFLVFVFIIMIGPSLSCEDTGGLMPECEIIGTFGDFLLGIAIIGILLLVDVALVYVLLSELIL